MYPLLPSPETFLILLQRVSLRHVPQTTSNEILRRPANRKPSKGTGAGNTRLAWRRGQANDGLSLLFSRQKVFRFSRNRSGSDYEAGRGGQGGTVKENRRSPFRDERLNSHGLG